jgi:hypothetical protein
MLVVLQIPIFDVRKFLDKKQESFDKPNWKFIEDSDVYSTFIRSIGPVDVRRTGKCSSGEDYFTKARRGIRFNELPVIKGLDNGVNASWLIKPKYRRFFFDGTVCGKYEIGFAVKLGKGQSVSGPALNDFLTSLLRCRVTIPVPYLEKKVTALIDSGRLLAKQYLYATTPRKKLVQSLHGVYPGIPCIYVEKEEGERIDINHVTDDSLIRIEGISISINKRRVDNKLIKVWTSQTQLPFKKTRAREVRIAIMRLNVFREALHFVLKKIDESKILPQPRSIASEELQSFFKDCFGKYLKKLPSDLSGTDYETLAVQIEDRFALANREHIGNNLRRVIDIRGNYFQTIRDYLKKTKPEAEIIRILLVFANPAGTDQLRLGREEKVIRNAVESGNSQENIALDACPAATIDDLRRALLKKKYKIVHISGHGSDSGLILEDESGLPKIIPKEALAELFTLHQSHDNGSIECVVLNACYALSQGELISSSVPYTVAMAGELGDMASIEFSRGFYDAIGAKKPVKYAYNQGCNAVRSKIPQGAHFSSKLFSKEN